MDIIIKTGFAAIKHNINFTSESVRKGKEIVAAKHLKNVEELQGLGGDILIRCEMRHSLSVNEPDYKVSLEVSKHMIFYVNQNCKVNF